MAPKIHLKHTVILFEQRVYSSWLTQISSTKTRQSNYLKGLLLGFDPGFSLKKPLFALVVASGESEWQTYDQKMSVRACKCACWIISRSGHLLCLIHFHRNSMVQTKRQPGSSDGCMCFLLSMCQREQWKCSITGVFLKKGKLKILTTRKSQRKYVSHPLVKISSSLSIPILEQHQKPRHFFDSCKKVSYNICESVGKKKEEHIIVSIILENCLKIRPEKSPSLLSLTVLLFPIHRHRNWVNG